MSPSNRSLDLWQAYHSAADCVCPQASKAVVVAVAAVVAVVAVDVGVMTLTCETYSKYKQRDYWLSFPPPDYSRIVRPHFLILDPRALSSHGLVLARISLAISLGGIAM